MTCPKCFGTGTINSYKHIQNGVCFECGGTGAVNGIENHVINLDKFHARGKAPYFKGTPIRMIKSSEHINGKGTVFYAAKIKDSILIRHNVKIGANWHIKIPYDLASAVLKKYFERLK